MIFKRQHSVQNWMPFEIIYENGIIKTKDNFFIKIIKITPINFNLKSNLEKEAILNSYKVFLRTCNFDLQILIQSKKEDLSKHISKIKKINIEKNKNEKKYLEEYIKYIEEKNKKSKSSSKNYFIIIREKNEAKNIKDEKIKNKICADRLNEKYFKIRECIGRCGNLATEINEKKDVEKILKSFLNKREENVINNENF